MSQAKRARLGCHGTGVKLAGSGMAAMSALCGPWPISPAANPANPAPSSKKSSRWAAGTSLAEGFPHMSTNWARRDSVPRSLISRRTSSRFCGRSLNVGPFLSLFPSNPECPGPLPFAGRFPGQPELHDLDGDAQRQPVLFFEVETRQLLDAGQPLAQRVRVGVDGPGRPHDVPAALQVHLERLEELGTPALVVLHQPVEPFLLAVPDAVLGVDHVAVGAEVLVGVHA